MLMSISIFPYFLPFCLKVRTAKCLHVKRFFLFSTLFNQIEVFDTLRSDPQPHIISVKKNRTYCFILVWIPANSMCSTWAKKKCEKGQIFSSVYILFFVFSECFSIWSHISVPNIHKYHIDLFRSVDWMEKYPK